jgi:hypothetical protein
MYFKSYHSREQIAIVTTSLCGKIRESLAVSKQTTYMFHMERFNLKKLKEVEGKEQHFVDISNRFTGSET